jgi:hypothetical protein
MGLDGIPATLQALPAVRGVAPRLQKSAEADGILRLSPEQTQGDDLLVDTEDGRRLRLSGAGSYGQELSDGDVLLVRVRSAAPELELEWLGSIARSGGAGRAPGGDPGSGTETAAMRLDQTALRRIVWQDPAPETLANAWRALVLGRWKSLVPPGAASGGAAPPALFADPASRLTAVYGWRGLQLMLSLVPDEPQGASSALPRSLSLRLELKLPTLGHILIELTWAGGIALAIAVEDDEALAALQASLPAIAARLVRAQLRLVRCRFSMGLEALRQKRPRQVSGAIAPVQPVLFRAAAEIVRELSFPSGAKPSPGSR